MPEHKRNLSATPLARTVPPLAPVGPNGERRKVLIVEDDAIQAIDMELTFEDAGYEIVGPAATEAEALALIARHRPDVAALDWNLRTGNTARIARALAGIGARTVFVTAARTEVERDVPEAHVLAKPVAPAQVVAALAA